MIVFGRCAGEAAARSATERGGSFSARCPRRSAYSRAEKPGVSSPTPIRCGWVEGLGCPTDMEENHRPDEGPSRRASALADASATRRIAIRRPRRAPFFASATFEATTGRSKKRSRMRKKKFAGDRKSA